MDPATFDWILRSVSRLEDYYHTEMPPKLLQRGSNSVETVLCKNCDPYFKLSENASAISFVLNDPSTENQTLVDRHGVDHRTAVKQLGDLRLSGSIIRKSRFIFTKERRIIRQKSGCLNCSNERIFQVYLQIQGAD